ncbi:MAG: nucleotidyltransferase family protein [Clostridiales bacterium]|nr:nucleotidyltransferase family protein [Clostridiales bacterium]
MSRVGVEIPKEQIAQFCQRHGIRELSLFGSVLRDDFGSCSDIDVLVDFAPGKAVSLFQLMEMEDELSQMLERKIDLVVKSALRGRVRDSILNNREVMYVAPR